MRRNCMATNDTLLLTPAAMGGVDAAAIASGIDGYGLMEKAGAHVAAVFLKHFPQARRAVVLSGPGNNGGDGHVAARLLADCGVQVARFGSQPKPGGDAALAHAACSGGIARLGDYRPEAGDVIVDALYGAGLDRPVGADAATVIEQVKAARLPVIAVDLPSGLSGHNGRAAGACFRALHTVTFAALKPGHLLMPGRALCGEIHLCDIGIPARLITSDDPLWRNGSAIYAAHMPQTDLAGHKYSRGHLAVFSGPLISGGAARMAVAGLRSGAGLVTMATPRGAVMLQAAHLTAIMQRSVSDAGDLASWLEDRRLSAFVLGPGFGDRAKARAFTGLLAGTGKPVLLDADGLSAFAESPESLSGLFAGATRLVVTPHEGEFRRLFGGPDDDARSSKVDRARLAAARINAIVVYKGADTVIAAPDGRAAINSDAPPWLATAGSGDVLAGVVGGLLAQGMPPFQAACAGVALHGQAAWRAGEGMTAEDLALAVGGSGRHGRDQCVSGSIGSD